MTEHAGLRPAKQVMDYSVYEVHCKFFRILENNTQRLADRLYKKHVRKCTVDLEFCSGVCINAAMGPLNS